MKKRIILVSLLTVLLVIGIVFYSYAYKCWDIQETCHGRKNGDACELSGKKGTWHFLKTVPKSKMLCSDFNMGCDADGGGPCSGLRQYDWDHQVWECLDSNGNPISRKGCDTNIRENSTYDCCDGTRAKATRGVKNKCEAQNN